MYVQSLLVQIGAGMHNCVVAGLLVSTPQLFTSVQVCVCVPLTQTLQPLHVQLGVQAGGGVAEHPYNAFNFALVEVPVYPVPRDKR